MSGLSTPFHKYAAAIVLMLLVLALIQVFSSRQVELDPDSTDLRIVSLAPNITTIVFSLGLGEQLVGVTSYCDDPPEAQLKTRVGDFIRPNLEMIMSLKPDLILAEDWPSSRAAERLRDLGQTVIEFQNPFSIQEIYQLIESVGRTLGESEKAAGLIESMTEKVATVRERARALPGRPTIYIENDVPTWTIGGPTFTSEAIALCGADNIFADLAHRAPRVSEETIIQRNPDFILSFVASAEQVLSRPGWEDIEAVKQARIIDQFEHRLLVRGNHRLADGMLSFQQILFRQIGISESK